MPAIGIRSFIDVAGDYVYFVWEGKLKIIKIDLKTGEQVAVFGHKTKHYIEPFASLKLLEGRLEKDFTKTGNERVNMSLVRDIFATPRHVLVVYEGPTTGNFRLQVYTPEGRFLDDIAIPGNPGQNTWFEKETYTLYSLLSTNGEKAQIFEFKIGGSR